MTARSMRARAAGYSCALIALAMPGTGFAQTLDTTALEEVVVSASRTGLKPREIGSSFSVIDAEDLQANQVTVLRDLLQDLPGIQISNNRPGGFSNLSIRGSDNDQVLVLIDGIELGDPSSTSTQFQMDHLTALDVSRIEVLRGNQSSLYGSDAIGGVINIVTRRATEDGLTLNGEMEGGSFGTFNGGASLYGKTGPLDVRLSVTGHRNDGPSLAAPTAGPSVEPDAYSRYGFSGRIGYQITDNLEIVATGFLSRTDSDLDGTGTDVSSNDNVEKDEDAAAIQVNHKAFDGRWRNSLLASYYQAERLYFGRSTRPEGDQYLGKKRNLNYTSAFDATEWLSVVVGGNLEEESTDQITSFSGDFIEKVDTKSVFGEVALKPLENLTLTGAFRYDDNSQFGGFDTYRGTVAYVLPAALAGGDLKLRASYGTGAKAPGLYQLYDPTYGNPNLTVEESQGWDAGFDLNWADPQINLTVNYFESHVEDEIEFILNGYRMGGESKSKGVEFGATAQITPWLSVSQSYTYLSSRKLPANTWKGRPRHSGATSVTIYPLEDLSITARARFKSENLSSGVNRPVDGFVTVDLLVSYRVNDQLELYGRVVNLFDKDYMLNWGNSTYGLSGFVGVRASLNVL
ncbi:TonB-dependent receptor [Iodidimonas sp. SYSU 1G8]|uniref:TonB-dependent receptor n=1 Tax=Iodidimonas sp. SYSU 1G8 TaxID=3133967 RepID=UPI0031FEE194